MSKQLLKSAFGWGLGLWLFGYILGFVFFALVPANLIGWVIMPFGITVTIWVLIKKIQCKIFNDYLVLAVVWTLIAVICDYFFLVKLLHPADGYYKLDVYLYYLITFILPVAAGLRKKPDAK
jgi:hypothetical protein